MALFHSLERLSTALFFVRRGPPRRPLRDVFLSLETFSLQSDFPLEESPHEALISFKNLSTELSSP